MNDPLCFADNGEASNQLRLLDLSASPLGAADRWPAAFRFLLSLVLSSPNAMYFAWGPERLFFFNEAYVPLLGNKLAGAMGSRFADVWADVYDDVCDAVDRTFAGETATFTERPLLMERDADGLVETFWTFSFSPVRDERSDVVRCFVAPSRRRSAGRAIVRVPLLCACTKISCRPIRTLSAPSTVLTPWPKS